MNTFTEDAGSDDKSCVMLQPCLYNINKLNKIFRKAHDNILANGHALCVETEPHITLLYGLIEDAPLAARSKLSEVLTSNFILKYLTVKDVTLFENDNADVLKLDFYTPDWLNNVHIALKELPNDYSFDLYSPHMTIAYITPGEGSNYITEDLLKLKGEIISFDSIIHTGFKDVNGNRVTTNIF